MMYRLRAVVCALAAVTVFTCIASVKWFLVTDHLVEQKVSRTSALPDPRWSRVAETMARRREEVESACEGRGGRRELGGAGAGGSGGGEGSSDSLSASSPPLDPRKLNNLIVDDKNRILYCYVPKVACTNWKRVMLILTGRTNETSPLSIRSDSVHRTNVFTKLSQLQPDAIQHRLQTYTKFLFVRHPIERVLSAFRNKFQKNYTSSAYFKKRFGVKIIKKYRQGIDPAQVPVTGDGVKFPEFVSYLIDTKRSQLNEHWATVSDMCHPCAVRYQIIGKYETLAEDSEYILRKVGASPDLHFPEIIPSKTTAIVESYFDMLSDEQQRNLIEIYRDDFELFGYHHRNLI
ncbi:carbohydrate sulfotransferase 11-like isoform X2 [Penaeus chinensis]|uniref:carbohydrate sulfotransferase 11-like isoform X2 n=1 Tax=Penaeus chinensis TaxID=139456 RepID=UPI001FB5D84A|nr:carbohydrate sulfotransferase 11-like isoform X2 [Penaeus chinensis]